MVHKSYSKCLIKKFKCVYSCLVFTFSKIFQRWDGLKNSPRLVSDILTGVTRCLSANSGVISFVVIQEKKDETSYCSPKLDLENGRNFLSHLWAQDDICKSHSERRPLILDTYQLNTMPNKQLEVFISPEKGFCLERVFQSFHDKIFFPSLCISELLCISSAAKQLKEDE